MILGLVMDTCCKRKNPLRTELSHVWWCVLYRNIDQKLVNSLHGLLNC